MAGKHRVAGLLVTAVAAALSALILLGDMLREGLSYTVMKAVVAAGVILVGVLAGLALWFKG